MPYVEAPPAEYELAHMQTGYFRELILELPEPTKYEVEITNNKIFFGFPNERFGLNQFYDSRDYVLNAVGEKEAQSGAFKVTSHRVDINRDRITEKFLEHPEKPDWLFFMDTDMDFPPNAALALREHELPIVGGLYFHRAPERRHDPIAFRFTGEEIDDLGLVTAHFRPVREEVHTYFEKNGVPYSQGSFFRPRGLGLLEIDAIGTGCLLIHRSVFDDMARPFWQYRLGRGSEDLDFCFRAKLLGIPVFLDMDVVCGHWSMRALGHNEFMKFHRLRGVWQTEYTEDDAVEYVNEFLEIEDGNSQLASYVPDQLAAIWQASEHGSPEEIRDFYALHETGEMYLKDLIHWNASPMFKDLKASLVGIEGINALDFGSGIGTMSIQLGLQNNNVVSVEINDLLREFAEWRWNMHVGNMYSKKMGLVKFQPDLSGIDKNSLDLVVIVDVLEHLHADDLKKYLDQIVSFMKIGARFFVHNSWGSQEVYPMHFDHGKLFKEIMRANNMFALENMWWVKVG